MGRFKHLVDSPVGMEGFKAKYHTPPGVVLEYYSLEGRITKDYLLNHRLIPHQCAPNLFRVLGSIDALNEQLGLGLT